MHLLRFKCKATGRTYQETLDGGNGCSACAFQTFKVDLEEGEVERALYDHCLSVSCIRRGTIFVEVTE